MEIRKYKNGNFAVKREPEYDLPLNDTLEIYARKDRLPLFALRVVT